MKKLIFIIFLMLTFCSLNFGQSTNCPTISVTGPSAGILPGETATFTANIVGNADYNVEYVWSVSSGEIVEGQGTPTISVETTDSTPTATVEIKGLPEGCPNTDSETGINIDPPESVKVDEFKITSKPIDAQRVAFYISDIKNNPGSKAYIFIYSNNKISLNETKKKERHIRENFSQELISNDRLVIIQSRSNKKDRENYITFWRVSEGATPPVP